MIVEVTMPVLGLTMEQGTIVSWLKGVGDHVEMGEPLLLVETDKATSDAPSPAAGTLAAILRGEDEAVAVGAVIALLAETAEDLEQVRMGAGRVADGAPGERAGAGQAQIERRHPRAAGGRTALRPLGRLPQGAGAGA